MSVSCATWAGSALIEPFHFGVRFGFTATSQSVPGAFVPFVLPM